MWGWGHSGGDSDWCFDVALGVGGVERYIGNTHLDTAPPRPTSNYPHLSVHPTPWHICSGHTNPTISICICSPWTPFLQIIAFDHLKLTIAVKWPDTIGDSCGGDNKRRAVSAVSVGILIGWFVHPCVQSYYLDTAALWLHCWDFSPFSALTTFFL